MRCQAALFDLDGTLLDTLADLADSMNEVLSDLGMPVHPVEPYRYFVGDGMLNLARRAAPAGTPESVLAKMVALMDEKYGQNWNRKTRPYEGVPELAAALRERGLRLAILSNKPDNFTKIMAEHYFPGVFDMVLGARAEVPRKPDPAAAWEIAAHFGLDSAAFLYFGDTDTDMRTGRAAGMRTIGVSWGFRPVEELRAAGAEAILDHPGQALALL